MERNIYIGYKFYFVDLYLTILMWRPLYSFITVLDSLAKCMHDRLEIIYFRTMISLRRLAALVEVHYLLEKILDEGKDFARLKYACMKDVENFIVRNGFKLIEKKLAHSEQYIPSRDTYKVQTSIM